MIILGVHFGHDANAALIVDGKVVAEVMEERFNRVKHSADPPIAATRYCLEEAGIDASEIDVVACSGRELHQDFGILFSGNGQTPPAPTYFSRIGLSPGTKVVSLDHHLCHAAASRHLSGLDEPSLVLVSDGFGDDCSISVWLGEGDGLKLLRKYGPEGSLGWFYSNVTEAMGWVHGDGEGKTMALASGGDPEVCREVLTPFCPGYRGGDLVSPHDFGPVNKLVLQGSIQWHLADADAIKALRETHRDVDLAASAQALLEEAHLSLVTHWLRETGVRQLCVGGGVFLNIILNRRLANMTECDRVFFNPNPTDAGLGLGAALAALAEAAPGELPKGLETLYLGPGYTDEELRAYLDANKLPYQEMDEEALCAAVADDLAADRCVGWFQGRMEAGPRALGNRSILMSPIKAEHKDYINDRVKFREPFRPFCPSLVAEDRDRYLVESEDGPCMILGFNAPEAIWKNIQAVVHVDGTIRPQVVTRESNPRYHRVISAFRERTGEGIVLNTSMNVKGEPVVLSPADAVRCFYSTGMDAMALGPFLLRKEG